MRPKHGWLLIIITVAAVVLLFWLGAGSENESEYTSFSSQPNGVSLLYDTLRQMQFPVAAGYTPVGAESAAKDVYLVIRPDDPSPSAMIIEDMLAWVRRGGRLIYLDNESPSLMDSALSTYASSEWGTLSHYSVGLGEVITGYAEDVVNQSLMNDSLYGSMLAYVLEAWEADHIWFAEYYHGYRVSDNFFARLPAPVKLVVYQMIILAAAYAWYKGKRFGKPVPYYEEIERGENEHIKALARLYYRRRVK